MGSQRESGHDGSAHRLVILASGSGSNAQAVIDACLTGVINADVVAVVSNRDDAGVLGRADDRQIERAVLTPHPGEDRSGYDARLADLVARFRPDHVLLLGWMRVLTKVFLDRFAGSVINLHPALPGELPGTDAIRRAFVEARSGSRSSTGVMLHLVPDEQVDAGPVLAHAVVPIHPHDTLETLAARMHEAEHALVVSTLSKRCNLKEIPV